jgi:fructoselysine-6-P-deglycase FrlB-like protein
MLSEKRGTVVMPKSFSELRGSSEEIQQTEGFAHTLAEIWQQPEVWVDSASRMALSADRWRERVQRAKSIVLTGSGSSYFAGKCAELALQERLSVLVQAIESGELLQLGPGALPPARPLLLVSFARSGDSPESCGLVSHLLATEPEVEHIVLTCNPRGRLARTWGAGGMQSDPRVTVLTLDERTCDRSLVMTSSFTSLVVAAAGLGYRANEWADYHATVDGLARSVADLLANSLDIIEAFPVERIDRMIAVGSGALQGAALEVSLKMLEMTDGKVLTRAETCLGLRHGPMCALHERTLTFLPLSNDRCRRAFQVDLLNEIDRKRLGGWKAIIGSQIPSQFVNQSDVAIEMPGLCGLSDEWIAIAAVVAGQLLAFLRCRAEGLQPDAPPLDDAITRVVGEFPLHGVASGVLE